jgi:hypothetical protein
MRAVDWTDDHGLRWRSLIPDDAQDSSAPFYTPLGPPDLSGLGLPSHIHAALHNELHRRQLWTWEELRHNREALNAAISLSLGMTTEAVIGVYYTDWQQGQEQAQAQPSTPLNGKHPTTPSTTAVASASPAEETT